MAELYLSMKALDTLYNGFGGIFSKMLTKQKSLYLDLTSEELKEKEENNSYSGDEENIIQQLKADGNMEIVAAKSICDKVKDGTYETSDSGASPVFIIELNENVPTDIRDTYGVLCIPDSRITRGSLAPLIESNTKYLKAPRDRRNEDTDDDKTEIVSWSSILKKSNQTCNAIVINDHFLFQNDGYKIDKSTPDKELKNLKEIIDSLLPLHQKEGNAQILLLCKKEDLGNITQRATHIKKTISELREYPITFEIISGNNSCPEFEYTHNRQVATNYAIINVDHVLAAFDENGAPTHDQPVRYMPLYSDGLWNDSDFPEKNHETFLERVYNINETANSYVEGKSSGYEYFQNGKVMNIHKTKVSNRLIGQFFGLRDGDNCSYLSVPNKSDWQNLYIKRKVYTRIGYKDCIVVPSKEEYRLQNIIPQIVDVFKNSPSVEGTNRDSKQDYYWVACTTASDIKTIHALSPDYGEKAPNYYLFNCYQTKQEAEAVVNGVINILKNNNFW